MTSPSQIGQLRVATEDERRELQLYSGHASSVSSTEELAKQQRQEITRLIPRGIANTISRVEFLDVLEEKRSKGKNAVDKCIRDLKDAGSNFDSSLRHVQDSVERIISRLTELTKYGRHLLDTTSPDDVIVTYDDWAKDLTKILNVSLEEDRTEIEQQFENLLKSISNRSRSIALSQTANLTPELPLQLHWHNLSSIQRRDETHCPQRVRTISPGLNDSAQVVYVDGGVEIVSARGPRALYAPDVVCRDAASLSDGRIVILLPDPILRIYKVTKEVENIKFRLEKAGVCESVAVDGKDNILLLADGAKKVLIFKPQGGSPYKCLSINAPNTDTPNVSQCRKLMLLGSGGFAIKYNDCCLRLFDSLGNLRSTFAVESNDVASYSVQTDDLWMLSPDGPKLGVFKRDGALLHEYRFKPSTLVHKGCAVASTMFFCQVTELSEAISTPGRRLIRLRSRTEYNPGSTAVTKFMWLEINQSPATIK